MKLQKAKIAKIIKNDATLADRYCDDDGNFCVIGGLLDAAGYPVKRLVKLGKNSSSVRALPRRLLDLLKKTFGLSLEQCARLQSVNDQNKDTRVRRLDLLAQLDRMEDEA